MKDFLFVLGGAALGFGARYPVWKLAEWLKSRRVLTGFKPAGRAPTLPPGAVPGPRPVRGQRPSEGAHRATQRQVRFTGRTWRSRRK